VEKIRENRNTIRIRGVVVDFGMAMIFLFSV